MLDVEPGDKRCSVSPSVFSFTFKVNGYTEGGGVCGYLTLRVDDANFHHEPDGLEIIGHKWPSGAANLSVRFSHDYPNISSRATPFSCGSGFTGDLLVSCHPFQIARLSSGSQSRSNVTWALEAALFNSQR